MIIDSHCHLDYPDLYKQLDNVVKRANDSKIKYLLTICTTLGSFEKIKTIVDKYKNVYGTIGIHPHETKSHEDINSKSIIKLINGQEKIIGIGETGLDFYYNHSDKKIQKKIFLEHIYAATELNIPLIVHSRDAEIDTFEILKSEKKNSDLKVLMHCFTGSYNFAKKLVDMNCYISLSGIITFKNSVELVNTVSKLPLQNLMVETDSPYLSPVPYRGKSNEPSYIKYTVKKLAEILNITEDEVMNKTSDNFLKLFNLNYHEN
tara:strand:+ start:130 stop:915 length:786 start_codon:yes stop_codon:yes gene_type:complete